MKKICLVIISIVVVVIIIPSIVVLSFEPSLIKPKINSTTDKNTLSQVQTNTNTVTVSVFRMSNKRTESMPLEEYVKGVVASEMPASYEIEALKAQAISARTYIVKSLLTNKKNNLSNGSDITDSKFNQVYKNKEQLKGEWGSNYKKYIDKISQAVNETSDLILTFNDQPIDASFFAISNGYTENSEDYWKTALPYLRSVPSPWDKTSPKFKETMTYSLDEIEKRIGVKVTGKIAIQRTSSNRVSSISINGKKMTGIDVREALGLQSTDFSFKVNGDHVLITTKGYGHGVGMSQYGANEMAKEGKKYKEILEYYYKGIAIEDVKSNIDFNTLLVNKENN